MRVQAIAEGYYNGLQKVGAIFLLEDKENEDGETVTAESQFSKRWMIEIDADGNPVRGTPKSKAALAKQAEEPSKNLAEKSTPSKNDNGTDVEVLKDRIEQAQKADDAGLDDGKVDDTGAEDGAGKDTTKAAPTRRSRTTKVEDTEAKKAETAEDVEDAADKDADKQEGGQSTDDGEADKTSAEGESRRRRRRG